MTTTEFENALEFSLHKIVEKRIINSSNEQLKELHEMIKNDRYTHISQFNLYNEMVFSEELKVLQVY